MSELVDFGEIVLVVAGAFSLALLSTKLTERISVPAPAIFLLAAALASDLVPALSEHISIRTVERIGVVALIVILFDGGMKVGWRRTRAAAAPIVVLGIVGTFATAGVMAVFAHAFFDFNWTVAWILGAALAPTDPAVMFSVLGNREVGGRSGTILEGESGGNDPVGIALVVGMLDFATHEDASIWTIVKDFSIEMAVGLAVGVAGAALLLQLMRRVSLPSESLYAIRTLVAAAVIYGAASVAHGSGFLAVFVAGLLLGDARAPFKHEIERFQSAFASLAEITVFAALGLTFHFSDLTKEGIWLDGILLAVLLGLVARPLVVYTLLAPMRMRWAERTFIAWTGLKGAVPILLSTFVLLEGLDAGPRIYNLVVVIVTFSVVVQGSTVTVAARLLRIPMRVRELEPYSLYVGLQEEPEGVVRYRVSERSQVAGRRVRDLPIGDRTWISLIVRDGVPIQPRGSSRIQPGDEVLVLTDPDDESAVRRVFEGKEG
ncbi:MAG TPA: potassium/proton antiporter [Gaiellaceae bacterium]